MRIFISHKFQNVDKVELKKKIETIVSILQKRGFQTFNYFRDKEKYKPKKFPPGKVIKEAFEELKKCDAILVFIDSPERSEGVFLEIGFALALEKKMILLIHEKVSVPTLEALADKVIKFRNFENLDFKLKKSIGK